MRISLLLILFVSTSGCMTSKAYHSENLNKIASPQYSAKNPLDYSLIIHIPNSAFLNLKSSYQDEINKKIDIVNDQPHYLNKLVKSSFKAWVRSNAFKGITYEKAGTPHEQKGIISLNNHSIGKRVNLFKKSPLSEKLRVEINSIVFKPSLSRFHDKYECSMSFKVTDSENRFLFSNTYLSSHSRKVFTAIDPAGSNREQVIENIFFAFFLHLHQILISE
jgi:hypothetical protein